MVLRLDTHFAHVTSFTCARRIQVDMMRASPHTADAAAAVHAGTTGKPGREGDIPRVGRVLRVRRGGPEELAGRARERLRGYWRDRSGARPRCFGARESRADAQPRHRLVLHNVSQTCHGRSLPRNSRARKEPLPGARSDIGDGRGCRVPPCLPRSSPAGVRILLGSGRESSGTRSGPEATFGLTRHGCIARDYPGTWRRNLAL